MKSLLERVAEYVVTNQTSGQAHIQRKFGLGRATTAQLFRDLASLGVVGEFPDYTVLVPYSAMGSVLVRVREFEAVTTNGQ